MRKAFLAYIAFAAAWLFCGISFAADARPMAPIPGMLTGVSTAIDLTYWKVTLPINADGVATGNTDAVEIPSPIGISVPPYYDVRPDWITFMAPTDGARTGGSHYPRSELREMDGKGNEYEWLAADGGHLTATLRVDELPKVVGKMQSRVVIGQIHGPNDELCRLYYDTDGNLYFVDDKSGAKQTETSFQLRAADGKKPKVPLGATFSYDIRADAEKLVVTITYDNVAYSATDALSVFWVDKPLYFKAGAYVQVALPGSEAMNQGQGRGSTTFFAISRPTHDVYNYTEEDGSDQKPVEEGASDVQIFAGCIVVVAHQLLEAGTSYDDAKAAAASSCDDVKEDFDATELQEVDRIVDSIL